MIRGKSSPCPGRKSNRGLAEGREGNGSPAGEKSCPLEEPLLRAGMPAPRPIFRKLEIFRGPGYATLRWPGIKGKRGGSGRLKGGGRSQMRVGRPIGVTGISFTSWAMGRGFSSEHLPVDCRQISNPAAFASTRVSSGFAPVLATVGRQPEKIYERPHLFEAHFQR